MPLTQRAQLELIEAERADVVEALRTCQGNVRRAAEMLGASRRTLDRRIVAYNLRDWLTQTYPRSGRQPARHRRRAPRKNKSSSP